MSNMYTVGGKTARSWNPFIGCNFNCLYCKPSFQAQLRRQKHRCLECYNYEPHIHPERLNKIPNRKIVFVCGNGDISFCPPEFTQKIIDSIKSVIRPRGNTYFFQSKHPAYFKQFEFPENVILLTTLETNKSAGYEKFSSAPEPFRRAWEFINIKHRRKAVTIEPILDFDLDIFVRWIRLIKPEHVWVGYNSKPERVQLPEPSLEKTRQLIVELEKFTEVRLKTMR